MQEKEPSAIELEMLKCKVKVYEDIRVVKDDVHILLGRMDNMEAKYGNLATVLKKHELQRASFNKEVSDQIKQLVGWFNNHDTKEMEKYSEIIDAMKDLTISVTNLTTATNDNTNFIDKIRKYRYGLMMWGAGAVAVAFGIWKILAWMQEKGMIIFFPSA